MVRSLLSRAGWLVLAALAAVFMLPFVWEPIAASVPFSLQTALVVFALVALATVAAALASAYHPVLFSWRKASGLPFDDRRLRLSM